MASITTVERELQRQLYEQELKICKGPLCKGSLKSHEEFHNNRNGWDGKAQRCKDCARHYQQSDNGRAAIKKSNDKRRASGYFKKWRQGKAYKEWSRKYLKSERFRRCVQNQKKKSPERFKAKSIFDEAVRRGRVPRITTRLCASCRKSAEQYHHPDYSRPLHVIPLCRQCHVDLHTELRSAQ